MRDTYENSVDGLKHTRAFFPANISNAAILFVYVNINMELGLISKDDFCS